MDTGRKGLNTICTHIGDLEDKEYKGAVSPLYMSTSYAYMDVDVKRYPRNYNTPNQEALCKKIAALEHTETALIFSSGMAAISTTLLGFLSAGDHVVLQQTLYGGTYALVTKHFERFGIEYSFTEGWEASDFEKEIKANTKVLYIETPSNPLLTITDMKVVSSLAKKHGLTTMIDNTFASPVNQNPIDFGIDVVLHSATKYMGGHSDISAGAVACSREHMKKVYDIAIDLGGNLSEYTVWLLERSIKTMGVRVKQHNENAMEMAQFLNAHKDITRVHYPGLASHPGHEIAKTQMNGFGGMMSFELNNEIDATQFQKELKLIKPSMSLAGVESTILTPAQTSHSRMEKSKREAQGITDGLIRFSVGIEEPQDLIDDIEQAIKKVKSIKKVVLQS
ncbi:cystathionine beta-lyase [Saonia flava]|uniref:Cystathionine beta-lyase n=1 Tax=Saonia flava TaxID=523696 RepID=A0A846QME4_9FLAO|nr:PLP-dependent aspartate aminotransferase family protein [Saonia flava]NJB70156.1 cystathionine beta-lyase [Saonia flava]